MSKTDKMAAFFVVFLITGIAVVMLCATVLACPGVYANAPFVPRTTAPEADSPYFTTENPFYNVGLGMPNCTAYAWGRAYEILGQRPPLNIGHARYWFYNEGGFPNPDDFFERGQTPRLGAIAVWGASNLGPFGHVAVVEAINADGTVDVSESFWGGQFFAFSQNVDVHHNEEWRTEPVDRNFLGFIYLCSVVETPAVYDPIDEPTYDPADTPTEDFVTDDLVTGDFATDDPATEDPATENLDADTYQLDYVNEPGLPALVVPAPPGGMRKLRFVIGSATFTDNDTEHTLEAAPFIENDRTMVPLRVIGEALGATDLAFSRGVITFNIGEQAFVMEVGAALPGNMGAPVIVAGRTFVPLAFIVDKMGANALWDGYAQAAYVFIGE